MSVPSPTTSGMFLQRGYGVGERSKTGFYIFACAMTYSKLTFFGFAHHRRLVDHGANGPPQRRFHRKVSIVLYPACQAEQEECNRVETGHVVHVLTA
jgi:hypothetical protein